MYQAIRSVLFLALAITSSVFGETSSASDKEALQNLAANFTSTWNRHDAKALAAFWAEDGDLLPPWGTRSVIRGRKEIEKHFADEELDKIKDSTLAMTVDNIRWIDPETAFLDADFTITGMKVAGIEAVPFQDHAIFLMVKREGKWQILIARPY